MFLIASISSPYLPIIWTTLAVAGALGVIALMSPRLFSKLAAIGGRWVDTSSILAKLDTRVDVDAHVLPYSRFLGAAVVASVGLLAFVLYGR